MPDSKKEEGENIGGSVVERYVNRGCSGSSPDLLLFFIFLLFLIKIDLAEIDRKKKDVWVEAVKLVGGKDVWLVLLPPKI